MPWSLNTVEGEHFAAGRFVAFGEHLFFETIILINKGSLTKSVQYGCFTQACINRIYSSMHLHRSSSQ
jgi:hypothetical protein